MKQLMQVVYRYFVLFASIGLMISASSCVSDQKDKDLISIQSFFERQDGSQWMVIEGEMRVYLKINDDEVKALEVWRSEMGLANLITQKECFFYDHESFNNDKVKILENSNGKLVFTYPDETWTFTRDGQRLKLEFKTSDQVRDPIYFEKNADDISKLKICPEDSSKGDADWRFLE